MPPEDNLTAGEMRDLMDYDPFSTEDVVEEPPAADPAPEQGASEEVAEAPQGAARAGETAAEPTPPTSAPKVGEAASPAGGNVEVGILQRLVESQARQIETLTKQMTQAPAGRQAPGQGNQAPSTEGPEAGGLPSYDFEIPDALIEGLAAEDPLQRKAAVKALVRGTALAVHQRMMEQLEPRFKSIPTEMETRFEARQREMQERERIRGDFYGAYPELNRPELSQFIGQVQATVLQETGIKEWSPTLRDAIGNRARQILGMATRAPAQPTSAPSQTIRPAVPAPPPAMQGSNTRPPATASGPVDEVYDLIMAR